MGRDRVTPFVIFSLPRSRSFWLSRFLTYGAWHCGHDELLHCDSLGAVGAWLRQPCVGTAETSAAPFWRLLSPTVRVVTVRRPVADVIASLHRAGLAFDTLLMTRVAAHHDRKLDQIEHRMPNVLSVRFEDLASEEVCAEVFEHCLPYAHDPEWWEEHDRQNLQINRAQMVAALSRGPQLRALAAEAGVACVRMMEA